MAAQASVLQEGEYSSLKDFKLEINRDEDSETFSLCFWIYLSNKSPIFPSTIIRQMRTGREGDIPFLILNKEKKMTLFPLLLPHEETPLSENSTSTKTDFPIEKWVHVGCEVSTNCTRLHIDGVVVGEKTPSPSLNNDSSSEDFKLILAGSDGDKRRLQGFVYYVHILPPASYISDHFVKNPPIYLTVDNSCISEIEEGEDGVWTIVGGKYRMCKWITPQADTWMLDTDGSFSEDRGGNGGLISDFTGNCTMGFTGYVEPVSITYYEMQAIECGARQVVKLGIGRLCVSTYFNAVIVFNKHGKGPPLEVPLPDPVYKEND
ncbi:hypothetical protein GIB67_015394 [Kingdonia uniflora]|uniref:Uncharacterized protein n=1 Tax=Kingdonia uniflora TaxID=39325 RepID=A0A7J7KYT9_9MAGN|nr:hypothetical protein GIB67_015394 [Kingdonia uniflora]